MCIKMSAGNSINPDWLLRACAAVRSDGACLEAAGLQLPASPWSARVVAGAHLMSGKGDTEKWARCVLMTLHPWHALLLLWGPACQPCIG